MEHHVVASSDAPAAIGPYSQAVRWGDLLFCSGQLGIDPATGDFVSEDVAEQARQAMENLGAVLRAAGMGYNNVLRTTIFLADMADFGAVNAVYGTYFEGAPPARATVAVRELPKGGRVEIDCIAGC